MPSLFPGPLVSFCKNIKTVEMKADGKGDEGGEGWIQLSDAYHHLPPPQSNLKSCTPSQQHEDTLQGQRRREM